MSTMTKLHCEIGDHDWERESQRGRKPRNCPKHQPVIETPTGEFRELHCELGDHDWQAPRKRGKPPRNCPEHAPVKAVIRSVIPPSREFAQAKANADAEPQKMRVLHCEGEPGAPETVHDYEVPSKRGKPPRWCPEHKPEIIKPEKTPKSSATAIRNTIERCRNHKSFQECKCGITVFTTRDEIKKMGCGCCDKKGWVCPFLDSVRRALGFPE